MLYIFSTPPSSTTLKVPSNLYETAGNTEVAFIASPVFTAPSCIANKSVFVISELIENVPSVVPANAIAFIPFFLANTFSVFLSNEQLFKKSIVIKGLLSPILVILMSIASFIAKFAMCSYLQIINKNFVYKKRLAILTKRTFINFNFFHPMFLFFFNLKLWTNHIHKSSIISVLFC